MDRRLANCHLQPPCPAPLGRGTEMQQVNPALAKLLDVAEARNFL